MSATTIFRLLFLTPLFYSTMSLALTPVDHGEFYYSYLGGSLNESPFAVTVDKEGSIYVTGETNSTTFDQFTNIEVSASTGQNCFVTKINPSLPKKQFHFIFAGSEYETCRGIVVDENLNVYVVGETKSNDLPMTTNIPFRGGWDAFVFKLSANGMLRYATYVGGNNVDFGHGITINGPDNVFITGETWSNNFPTTQNAIINDCVKLNICDGINANAFLTHIDTSTTLEFQSIYSTYFGGAAQDKSHTIKIDGSGIIHIAGETRSADFPLKHEISAVKNNDYDGFLARFDITLSGSESLVFSTGLGGMAYDAVLSIDVDNEGNTYLTGESLSDDFITTENAFNRNCAVGEKACQSNNSAISHRDMFVSAISSEFNPQLIYSSLIGGKENDAGMSINHTGLKSFVVTGISHSKDFPLTNNATATNCQSICKDNPTGVVLKFDANKTGENSLVYSSYLDGFEENQLFSTYYNEEKYFILTGHTETDTLATNDAFDSHLENGEVFVKIMAIDNNGRWINKSDTNESKSKKSSGSISVFVFLFFIVHLLLYIFRMPRKNLVLVRNNILLNNKKHSRLAITSINR